MPTKKKRIGFIPREDVMRIIDNLSIENNLSNSKIISILVEEALSMRGIFNKKNGKATQSFQSYNESSLSSSDNSDEFVKNTKLTINTKLGNHFNSDQSGHLNKPSHEAFDLQTYKKFLLFLEFQDMIDRFET